MNAKPPRFDRLKWAMITASVDIVLTNMGLFLGLVIRYVLLIGLNQAPRILPDFATPADLWHQSIEAYISVAPLLSMIVLVVFTGIGFYREDSRYHTRKVATLLQAVTAVFLTSAFAAYLMVALRYLMGQQIFAPFPRSALFAGWICALILLFAASHATSVCVDVSEGRLAVRTIRNRYFLIGDLLLVTLAAWLSFLARLEVSGIAAFQIPLLVYLTATIAVKPITYHLFGLYRRYWQYASIGELITIVEANAVATLGVILCGYLIIPIFFLFDPIPRSIPFIDFLITTSFVGGARFLARLLGDRRLMTHWATTTQPDAQPTRRVAIIGAGDAGTMIAREMQANPRLGLNPVIFLDDNPRKHGAVIHGVRVVGDRYCLADAVAKFHVQQAIIAMPTAPGKTIGELMRLCQETNVPVKTVPGIFELLDGSVTVNQLRNVDIVDLLRREPVVTDLLQVVRLVAGKRVLVTGAGGSIGSELCRQIVPCKPAMLIMMGHGENSLFEITNELRQMHANMIFHVVVADIRDENRMQIVFKRYAPQIIFHAAAHKHVPLMEENVEEAVTNNVQGTRCLLAQAERHQVEQFILISSDKAVNPTNVMGATKRIGELLVQEAALRTGHTFATVRFGNVLGSRGSVVPFFKGQIVRGGPVTITHPEICRYFMTIPEAVQLVLQAATLAKGGEIFVLDMGRPIRIVDLARDLIRLSGLEEGQDIDIVFTGLRSGEKLYEELFAEGETPCRTSHEKILAVAGQKAPRQFQDLTACIDELICAAQVGDIVGTRQLLRRIVPEFRGPASVGGSTSTTKPAVTTRNSLQSLGPAVE